ncbi:MAG: flagellar basal body-associated FliL family protein [Alphaproteobacteria bacterium]
MADEEDQVDENETAEGEDGDLDDKKKGGKKKLLMILVPILLLGGGGAGAYFMGYLDGLLGVEAEEGDEHAEEGAHGEEDDGHGEKKASHSKKGDGHGGGHGEEGGGETAFLEIPPMIVNLNTQDGTPRYLRLTVQLELEDPDDKGAVEAVIPRVIDQFQTYLRELRERDLRGSAGVYRLQMELLWRVNQAVEPIEVKDVLFQEILIQ